MPTLTVENVLLALKEYIQVYVNQVLYYNCVYPSEIFEKVTSFDLVVYKSRSPSLNHYIDTFANNFIRVLAQGSHGNGGAVDQLIVLLYDAKSNRPLRRYIVGFNEFIDLSSKITTFEFLDSGSSSVNSKIDIPGFSWAEIYTQFKSSLYLAVFELKKLEISPDNDLFFKILVNLENSVDLTFGETDDTGQINTSSNWIKLTGSSSKTNVLVPVGEVSIGFLNFSLHNEYL